MITANIPTSTLENAIAGHALQDRQILELEYCALFPNRSPAGLSDDRLAFEIYMDAATWSNEL